MESLENWSREKIPEYSFDLTDENLWLDPSKGKTNISNDSFFSGSL